MKVKFGIREKILVFFLALSLTSLGVISFVAVRSMGEMGYIVKQNSISMGETVVNTSIAALEDLGRRLLQQKAVDVAKEIELFFERHPDLEVSECKGNEELRVIAIQRVGRTGYTMVYDKSYTVYFSANPNLVGANLHRVAGEPAHYWSILERSVVGEASGYYDWEDEEGNIRAKYMYCVPVEGTELVVAATTYIDEFSAPAEGTKSKIASAVLATSEYIDEQMDKAQLTFIVVILAMVVVVSGLGFLLARTITGPILELTKGAEVIGKGKLDYSIEMNTGDEIQQLAEQFNTMASTLKESYTNLEQKVEERTKRERQRAEQLRTLNEVSRKISSIVNLNELLPYVSNLLRQTFHYHSVNIFLFEPESGKVTLKALCLSGQEGLIPVGVPLEIDEDSIVGWVAQTGEPLLANDVGKEPKYRAVEALSSTKSELAVAVKMGEKVLGVLDIESAEVDAFGEADLFTAQTLADQLAVALENARLYEETRQLAVMDERNRMAREIHDTLAQGFTGIILQLEAADQALSERPSELERHLSQAQNLARKSLAEARRSVWNLRPQALEQLPLAEALGQEVDRFNKETGINVRFTVSGDRRDLLPEVETGLLRICQESLANVRKHAKASDVEVNLTFNESAVEMSISDNGVGFKPDTTDRVSKKRGAFGLIGMRERARGLGGTFEVQSKKGKGTLVHTVIPTK
ncbi:MAG: HAMP domain-containing protein [Dehalococcoidia bacterium]|nr:MAG: HAMP domain-containing protein [Dehalococcoidia bacterium]